MLRFGNNVLKNRHVPARGRVIGGVVAGCAGRPAPAECRVYLQ